MSLWQVALILVGFVIVAAVYYAYMQAELFRLRRYEHWSDRFYSAAKPLVANPETPSSIIELIESLNGLMTARNAPFGIADVFKRRVEVGYSEAKDEKPSEEYRSFFKKYPELLDKAQAVSRIGLLAPTYIRQVGGPQARAILADLFTQMDLRHQEVGDVSDVREAIVVNRGPSLVPLITRR